MFDNWINEWEYPNIGIPFGETQTAGHDMYFMDYRNLDAVGEPIIVHVENEGDLEDIKITKVADNFKEFLKMVLSGKLSEQPEKLLIFILWWIEYDRFQSLFIRKPCKINADIRKKIMNHIDV